jgi:hypothetical protein
MSTCLEGANLAGTHLEGAFFTTQRLHLENANLWGAHLEGADLHDAHLEGANLLVAHLEGSFFSNAHLEGANLRGAFFSTATNLSGAVVLDGQHGMVSVADVRWQGANLAVLSWPERPLLGDEHAATELEKKPLNLSKHTTREERRKADEDRRKSTQDAWRVAARAYQQLTNVMRDQGMSAEADRFAYRWNVCQRQLYRAQGGRHRWFGSWLLNLVSGYGYRPLRTVVTYMLVVTLFGLAYWTLGVQTGHTLTWNEAGVISLTAFHGRGFFATAFQPGDPQAALAAIEAVIGLLIEILFIATFTQRFFAR